MELGTTIIGLIVIALCIIPFVAIHKNRINKEKQFETWLREVAAEYRSDISKFTCGLNFAIGISSDQQFVFFYKSNNGQVVEQAVQLNTIRKCYADTISRVQNAKVGTETIIQRMDLVFIPKAKSLHPARLEFFNENERFQPNGEKQLMKDWESIVNKNLII